MDKTLIHEQLQAYVVLKHQKNDIETRIAELRKQILAYCDEQQLTEFESEGYRVKLIQQERIEYDDQKLYHALNDPSIWRMISKADASKIKSMLKLNVLNEATISHTFISKQVLLLKVEKK